MFGIVSVIRAATDFSCVWTGSFVIADMLCLQTLWIIFSRFDLLPCWTSVQKLLWLICCPVWRSFQESFSPTTSSSDVPVGFLHATLSERTRDVKCRFPAEKALRPQPSTSVVEMLLDVTRCTDIRVLVIVINSQNSWWFCVCLSLRFFFGLPMN